MHIVKKPIRQFPVALLAALLFAACSAPLRVVSPRNGSEVQTLGQVKLEYLSMPREARVRNFSDADYRKKMVTEGFYPVPTVLEWRRDPDAAFRGGSAMVSLVRDGEVSPVLVTNVPVTEAGGSVTIDNLEIARKYRWTATESETGYSVSGSFSTADLAPRLIRLPDVPNVRDLGGRKGLGGRRVRQGMVFRSAGLNENARLEFFTSEELAKRAESAEKDDRPAWQRKIKKGTKGRNRLKEGSLRYALDTLGIKTDIDLRTPEECWGMEGSPLGPTVKWLNYSSAQYNTMDQPWGKRAFANVFRVFMDEGNYPIVFHCIAGQDRTGAVAFILNALLGVEEDELWRDWEMTGFWNPNLGFSHDKFKGLIDVFSRYPGNTMNEKVEAYVLSCGITGDEIGKLRAIMLE